MNKFITHNGKHYVYTNVTLEIGATHKHSCDICDLRIPCINGKRFKCEAYHCYKLVNEQEKQKK